MRAPLAETTAASRRCRCGRCGADYEPGRFADLAPVQTFAGNDLADHVVHWPDGVVVDVRACARCKSPIARLTRSAS
jgi:hypothetical protein